MNSTWSYFKGKLRRKPPPSPSGRPAAAAAASPCGEWEEDAVTPSPSSLLHCKNRRVADGSLLTCIGSDASNLAGKTRLSRIRAWRCLESRWWLSGSGPAPTPDGGPGEDGGLLPPPAPAPPADPATQPLLLPPPHLRCRHRGLWRAASDDDLATASSAVGDVGDVHECRRNSLSMFDENVGSDLPPAAWAAVVACCSPADAAAAAVCPTADLLDIGDV